MVRVLLERIYHPPLTPQPMTVECWNKRHEDADRCLEARNVKGISSFVALDGTRSICVMEAPYADIVREASREAKLSFHRVWRAQFSSILSHEATIDCSSPLVVEVSYRPSITKEQWEQSQQKLQPFLQQLGICQLPSYLAFTGEHGIDIFSVPNAETICSLYSQLGFAFDLVWQSQLILYL